MTDFFDELDSAYVEELNTKPFHSVKDKKDKEILDWLNKVYQSLDKQSVSRFTTYKSNLASYRGINRNKPHLPRDSEKPYMNKVNKFVVNHLYDMTETKISQMCRIKPSVDVLPTNDEHSDKNAAIALKHLINHLWYLYNMDSLLQKMQRNARIKQE